ncbi:MAG TPA: phosphoglucomutase/phosphomannomutase family protein [Candidatus Coatesbacteria bacterium]|nr:phosphoglucomutase/phosphomannomutase family protein [Candidatus Coatesbacteria bacterium]
MAISFGTSGWRALIADEFTFANVRRVAAAVARFLVETGDAAKGVLVSYDTRFLADSFAWCAADEFLRHGVGVRLTDRDAPTPAIAHAVVTGGLGGAVNLTASHNPPRYCGLKFSPATGAAAPTEVTDRIEEILKMEIEVRGEGPVEREDLLENPGCALVSVKEPYLARLEEIVDTQALEANPLKIVVDCLYGTCRGYLPEFLLDHGCEVKVLHAYRDAFFGGHTPEPSGPSLEELSQAVRDSDAVVGLACDGDADRFGVVDSFGHYVNSNMVLALVFWHLARHRGWEGGVARSVATTHLVDALAKKLGRKVFQTPVGIKHLAEWVQKGEALLGGEESSGICFRDHVLDKDGILACAIVAEALARSGRSVRQLIEDLYVEAGRRYLDGRLNLRLTEELAPLVRERLAGEPPKTFAGVAVVGTDRTDGLKLLLADDCWVMLRPSGTEPVVRMYAEAHDEGRLDELVTATREYLFEGAG